MGWFIFNCKRNVLPERYNLLQHTATYHSSYMSGITHAFTALTINTSQKNTSINDTNILL